MAVVNSVKSKIQENSAAVRAVAVVAGVGLLALAMPVILAAAKAGLGLLAIGGMGLALVGVVRALPLLGQKWENKILAMRKAEAAANPIEQMQNSLLQRSEVLKQFMDALKNIKAQIDGMADMLSQRKKVKPDADYSAQEGALKKMYTYYENGVVKAKRAKGELDNYQDLIQEKIFQWEFAQAGKQALAAMSPLDQKNILNEILSDTAVKSVQDSFNSVFAEIDLEVQTLSGNKALTFDGGMSIDTSHIEIAQAQPLSWK